MSLMSEHEEQGARELAVGSVPASQPGNKKRKRAGRGIAGVRGKTCGRGMKGQKARNTVRRGFEGGQTPLQRRLPRRRGVSQRALNIGMFRKEYAEINVGRLQDLCEDGTTITPQWLLERGVVRDLRSGLRVLGDGDLTRRLTVRAHHFTKAAKAKIEAAGGTAELI